MCVREDVQLRYKERDNVYVFVLHVDDDISLQFSDPKIFYVQFQEMKMTQVQEKWQSMSSHCRVAREISGCPDYRNSAAFLGNHKLSDDLRSFVCRGWL